MKNVKSKAIKIAFSIGVLLFLGVFFSISVSAQKTEPMPPPQFMDVTVVTVKPDMAMEFENLIKNEYKPGFTKGGGTVSDVWQMAFGSAFEYVFVQPVGKFADMDGPSPLEKGMGKQGAGAFFAKASKMVTGVKSYIIRARPDLSFTPDAKWQPKMAVVSHVQVAQGRENEFENFIKNEWMPVVKKSGVPGYLVSQVVFGGNVNEYITLVLQESFTELDKGAPPIRVLGQEGAMKLQQKLPAGTVTRLERYVIRYNPELSVMPSPTAAK